MLPLPELHRDRQPGLRTRNGYLPNRLSSQMGLVRQRQGLPYQSLHTDPGPAATSATRSPAATSSAPSQAVTSVAPGPATTSATRGPALRQRGISFVKIRGFKVADYNPRPAPRPWNLRRCVEHRGAHQGRFHSPRRFSEARVRKKGPGAHGTALGRTGLVRTASQLFSGELGANHTNHITSNKSHTPTTSPTPKTTRQSSQQPRQHHTNATLAASTAPAPEATHQPHHQHQKPRANQTSNPGNTTPTPH